MKELARRFSAVSVREESGVELCRRLWDVTAVRMPDPTMLLGPEEYAECLLPSNVLNNENIVTYFLDRDDEKHAISETACELYDIEAYHLVRPEVPSYRALRRSPEQFERPSVEEWLEAIRGAELVITDSFHGCIFSILFNRRFLVVPNSRRGTARFNTLLGLFGLTGRIVYNAEETAEALASTIDWKAVNARLAEERRRGRSFLRTHLSSGD